MGGLTRFSITRPLAMLMLILGLVLLGWQARSLMKVDRMPAMSFPFVNVSVGYAGASPEDVEALIIRPVERAVSGVTGVASVSAVAQQGRGTVNIQLVEGADGDKIAIDIERRVASIRNRLPADADVPTVNKADPNSFPVMNVVLSGQRPLDELYDLAVDVVQPRLQAVLGVADVSVSGGLVKEIQVQVGFDRLEAYGLSLNQVTAALNRENINAPAGTIEQGRRNMVIRTAGLFRSIDDVKNVVIATSGGPALTGGFTGTGGTGGTPTVGGTAAQTIQAGPVGPIRIKDVAIVSAGFKSRTRVLRYNGAETVGLSITKQSDANSLQVADGARAALEQAERFLPPGVRLVVTNDNSRFTRSALDAVQNDLAIAVILTGLVLLLFLHTWQNTAIVVLAIPTSLISTFLVMWVLGFSLNTISLMALALMIGVLVDDAIVVLENIHRHLKMGEAPVEAAVNGRHEIGTAAVAMTMAYVVVYVPVAFMQGNIGKLFREYGLTIAAATLFSLFISFTLTPMLASRWLKQHNGSDRQNLWSRFTDTWERNFDRVAGTYGRTLGLSLRVRPLVVLIGVVALGASLAFIPLRLIGMEYAPQEDDNQFNASLDMPPGTSLVVADRAMQQLEAYVARIPELEAMYSSVGGGGGGFGGGGAGGSIAVQLVEKSHRSRSVFDIMSDVRRFGQSIPEASVRAQATSTIGGGFGGMQFRVVGPDLDTLKALSSQVVDLVRRTPGVVDAVNPSVAGEPEIRTVLDRQKMVEVGLTAAQVSAAVRAAVGGAVAGAYRVEGEEQRDITVIAVPGDRFDLRRLENLPITTSGGTVIRLGQVAKLEEGTGPVRINRQDRQRVITFNANVAGRPLGDVVRDVREDLARMRLPDGYAVVVAGQANQLDAAMAALLAALGLSVILIYMLLVALYESWLHPLAIMFALPVSLVGAFVGLFLTGNTFNIFSMIGIIMLMGLVTKNAILLVDFTNRLRKRGLPRREAIIEAGRIRLRPIVMTTMTVIAAMSPLALKLEAGAESRAPMAVVVIGGVISSTLLTLVLVPVMYSYLDDFQNFVGRLRLPRRRKVEQPHLAPTPVPVGLPAGGLKPMTGGSDAGPSA